MVTLHVTRRPNVRRLRRAVPDVQVGPSGSGWWVEADVPEHELLDALEGCWCPRPHVDLTDD